MYMKWMSEQHICLDKHVSISVKNKRLQGIHSYSFNLLVAIYMHKIHIGIMNLMFKKLGVMYIS